MHEPPESVPPLTGMPLVVHDPHDWEAMADELAEAIRLTREYVEPKVRLPAIAGWSWHDALTRYRQMKEIRRA